MPQNASSRRESRKAWRDEIERRRNVFVMALMLLNEADEAVSAGSFKRAREALKKVDNAMEAYT